MEDIELSCEYCDDFISGINWDSLSLTYIICPCCLNKMTVHYDEFYDEETSEVDELWWLEKYEDNK